MSDKKQSSVEWLESAMNRIVEKNNIEAEKIIWEQAKDGNYHIPNLDRIVWTKQS